MSKPAPSLVSFIVAVAAVTVVSYFILLTDTIFHISVSSVIQASQHVAAKSHLIILGLLPIYIAAMMFGAAFFGIYLGSRLEGFFLRAARNK